MMRVRTLLLAAGGVGLLGMAALLDVEHDGFVPATGPAPDAAPADLPVQVQPEQTEFVRRPRVLEPHALRAHDPDSASQRATAIKRIGVEPARPRPEHALVEGTAVNARISDTAEITVVGIPLPVRAPRSPAALAQIERLAQIARRRDEASAYDAELDLTGPAPPALIDAVARDEDDRRAQAARKRRAGFGSPRSARSRRKPKSKRAAAATPALVYQSQDSRDPFTRN